MAKRRRKRKKNPAWVLPVAIAGGAVVAGTLVVLGIRRYRKINALEPSTPDEPIVEPGSQVVDSGQVEQFMLDPTAPPGATGSDAGFPIVARWRVEKANVDGTYSAYGRVVNIALNTNQTDFREAHDLPSLEVARMTAITYAGEALKHAINQWIATNPGWQLRLT